MSRLEFKNSPQDVTKRERIDYFFDVSKWLGAGDVFSTPAATLYDDLTKATVAGAVVAVTQPGAALVKVTLDWAVADIKRERWYELGIGGNIGTQFKEGFARFRTYKI